MKISKLVLLALAIGCFSSAAFADANFGNQGGNLFAKQTSGMYYLTTGSAGSSLTSVTGAPPGFDCGGQLPACSGLVTYSTPFTTLAGINNVIGGPTIWSTGGGSFSIKENGVTVFNGSFSSATWTYIGTCTSTVSCNTPGEYYEWELTGNVSGTYMGTHVNGATVQLTTTKIVAKNGKPVNDPFGPNGKGFIGLGGGNSNFPVVPESSTLILFGMGLVGIALFARRRRSAGLPT